MAEMICEETASYLKELAAKYETAEFLKKDPSKFMHRYAEKTEQELAAFISANLAFGRRDQILKHIEIVLGQCGGGISEWILSGRYKSFFTQGSKSFYRIYSHSHMELFFDSVKKILEAKGSLGSFFREQAENEKNPSLLAHSGAASLLPIIRRQFPKECALIPQTETSSCKRLNLFLRWMVRGDSPVDLGLWDWYKKCDLLIPLDTHVMQESVKLGLFEKTASGNVPSATLKNDMLLTDKMRSVFGSDPTAADYALFGLGVDG